MLYWDTLSEAVSLAHREGYAPHFVETNCSFAVSDEIVQQRLVFLVTHGVKGVYASADPFHQEFIPAERFLRVRRFAKEIFGKNNFWGPDNSDVEIEGFRSIVDDEAQFRAYVRKRPLNIVGTAHRKLSQYLDKYSSHDRKLPARGWEGATVVGGCSPAFEADTMWELHIDPYHNIQTNCGILLGKVTEVNLSRLLAEGVCGSSYLMQTVCEKGPMGLAELAHREYGFVIPEQVAQTCELCYLTRRFLHKFHPNVFGPGEIYR